MRLIWLGGLVAAAALAIVIVLLASTSGGGSGKKTTASGLTHKQALATVQSEIGGIPQSGVTLGNPNAPVTITEWGDLVCSTCDAFALTTEPQIIAALVKTGQAKLVYRGYDTASSYANEGEYATGQVAAKAAGLQNKAWTYILLNYEEQPSTVGGKDAELVPYYTTGYIQSLAAQIPGLNLIKWSSNLTNQKLVSQVTADGAAGTAAGVQGTPGVFVSGPKGGSLVQTTSYPTLAQVQALVSQYR